jgi:hypothetical protein
MPFPRVRQARFCKVRIVETNLRRLRRIVENGKYDPNQ